MPVPLAWQYATYRQSGDMHAAQLGIANVCVELAERSHTSTYREGTLTGTSLNPVPSRDGGTGTARNPAGIQIETTTLPYAQRSQGMAVPISSCCHGRATRKGLLEPYPSV